MPEPPDDLEARLIAAIRQQLGAEREIQDHAKDGGLGADVIAELLARMAKMQARLDVLEKQGLSSRPKQRSLSVVNDQPLTTPPRSDRIGRPLLSNHPFPRALEAAGSSVEEWAPQHGLKPKTVRSWYGIGPNAGRRIPRALAEMIEREFGIPATQAVWHNGIK